MRGSLARALGVVITRINRPSHGPAAAPSLMEGLEGRQLLSTYYVSPNGSDSRAGTSQGAAWKTISRVNKQKLKPGDLVLFQGGKAFGGSLTVAANEAGNASKPVTFSTYGSGRATINSGAKSGLDIAQTAGIAVANLNFVGSGTSSNKAPGIYVHVDGGKKKLSSLHIKNVEVRNYGREGIKIWVNGKGGSSLSGVKIEDASLHDNLYGGLKATAMKHNVNQNWVIQRVRAFNNHGSSSAGDVTGSGIYIADVNGATIQHCVAYNNGKDGSAPVGIWVAGSNRVTVQHNESYGNKTRTNTDGGGFDFDWDVNNSVMQYNYSHDNHGPGYLLCAATTGGSNNVLRYNVSQNDGRKNGVGGIQLYGNVTGAKIHNNTVYISGTGSGNTSAFRAHDLGSNGKVPKNVEVRNNIFFATGSAKVINLSGGVAAKGTISFQGNAYHGANGFKIQWGTKSYSSLSSWRNGKGQEKLNGKATGFQGNPQLVAAGQGGTINSTSKLKTLSAYKLKASSPLANKGIAPTTFLSSVVKNDFFGEKALKGGKHDIGAHEVK